MVNFTRAELEAKARKEIQALAKEFGLKANAATQALIDGILSHCEQQVQPEPQTALIEEPLAVTTIEKFDRVKEEVIAPPTEIEVIEVSTAPVTQDEFKLGSKVEVEIEFVWQSAIIKRINKKSIRVLVESSQKQFTVKNEECRWPIETEKQISPISPIRENFTTQIPQEDHISEAITLPEDIPAIADEVDCEISSHAPLTQDSFCHDNEMEIVSHQEVTCDGALIESSTPVQTAKIFSLASPQPITTPVEKLTPGAQADIYATEQVADHMDSLDMMIAPTPAPSHIQRKRKSLEIRKSLSQLSETISMLDTEPQGKKVIVPATSSIDIRTAAILKQGNPVLANRPFDNSFSSSGTIRAKVTPGSRGTTVTTGKKAGPDFAKAHASHFNGQKSITEIVHRNESVALNMEKAMTNAQLGVIPENLAGNHSANPLKVTQSSASNPHHFKALPMPKFKHVEVKVTSKQQIRSKTPLPLPSSSARNKENSTTTTNSSKFSSVASAPKADVKRDEKKSIYLEKGKVDRMAEFLARRRSNGTPSKAGAFSAANLQSKVENPFHYCN